MTFLFYCILIGSVFFAQITIIPAGDLPLAVLIALLFFIDQKHALVSSVIFGFLLDIFSPLFGLHLILYPAVVLLASRISSALLTDQSFLSFAVLSAGGFILYWLGAEVVLAVHAWITNAERISLAFTASQLAIAFAVQSGAIGTLYLCGTMISRRLRAAYHYAK